MRKVAEIFVSDNGKELFIYGGYDNLFSVEKAGEGFNTESFTDSVVSAISDTLEGNE